MFKNRLLKKMILMVSMLGMILLSVPSTSSAADVWCYSKNGFAYYLVSDSIKETNTHPPYQGMVKIVREDNGQGWNFVICGFAKENDIITAYAFERSSGRWGYCGKASDDPFYYAVWQAMKPYL